MILSLSGLRGIARCIAIVGLTTGLQLGVPRGALAQLDVSGHWRVEFRDPIFGVWRETVLGLAQTATSVAASAPYSSGTLDQGTGNLSLQGTVPCFDAGAETTVGPIVIFATVAPDGASFEGSFIDSQQVGSWCETISGLVHGVRITTTCGNGVVDPGEACDAGLLGGSCCTLECTAAPAGDACSEPGHACGVGRCDGAGACILAPRAGGFFCRASGGPCDAPEICDGASLDCPADSGATGDPGMCEVCDGPPLASASLTLGSRGALATMRLAARVALPPGETLSEPSTTWKLLTVRDTFGNPVVERWVAPGLAGGNFPAGWFRRGTRWIHRSSMGGALEMSLRPARDGRVSVRVQLRDFPVREVGFVPPLHLEVVLDGVGPSRQCGEASFAVAAAAGPACRIDRSGTTVRCR